MKLLRLLTCLILFFSTAINAQIKLEKTKTFFPDNKELKEEKIDWFYFSVPENWNSTQGRKVKLAVAVLKNTNKIKSEPVVFIQGGPGGNTIETTMFWVNHPLRKNHDIVLLDLRGTGFSEPKLCPDLGKKFFEILSKNQSNEKDISDKVKVSLECKQDMINQGIDLSAYNSNSVSMDLNALKKALKYQKWNVLGVSYGTHISQTYANLFPDDINSLILDSSIPEIGNYYVNNTKNYELSLQKLFDDCRNNPDCNASFPNLEQVYYNNISALQKKPITVKVNKSIVPSGTFTYNAEDYKIAIQQSLYDKKLVEVLPLLIYQFKNRNETTLAGLVQAFSGALSLNYGNYFCFTCNEVIPFNNLNEYNTVSRSTKLKEGLSFYKSDFEVCKKWNSVSKLNTKKNDFKPNNNKYKVLVLSGGFDPITPTYFGYETAKKFNNSFVIEGYTYGHGLGYTKSGREIINNFIENKPITDSLKQYFNKKRVEFKSDIEINKTVVKLGGEVSSKQWYYFIPLLLSMFVLFSSLCYTTYAVIKNKLNTNLNTWLLFSASLISIVFLIFLTLSINSVMNDNFYILAFGLPKEWSFVNYLYLISLFLSLSFVIHSLIKRMKSNIPLYSMLILSFFLLHFYFFKWYVD
ncbi:alpha/beta fold hydrolase [Flavobacterium oreochromis]|uniref:alpha/beta fold hydrolase n=1 Tax=Flavobacterium oreochromis TaxID=2906078 RepID=UPI001CE574F7|nr:alpha/beta fold hydrolase [Flavobacterium oreochromis]QYS86464.1 alpha/beta fold hydrolase [Flavobacterium oreochromis]